MAEMKSIRYCLTQLQLSKVAKDAAKVRASGLHLYNVKKWELGPKYAKFPKFKFKISLVLPIILNLRQTSLANIQDVATFSADVITHRWFSK